MTRPKDYTDMQHGKLTAKEYAGYSRNKKRVWRFECECGNKAHYAPAVNVFSGHRGINSCGCGKVEQLKKVHAKKCWLLTCFKPGVAHPHNRWLSQLRLPDGRFAPRGYVSKRVFKFMED